MGPGAPGQFGDLWRDADWLVAPRPSAFGLWQWLSLAEGRPCWPAPRVWDAYAALEQAAAAEVASGDPLGPGDAAEWLHALRRASPGEGGAGLRLRVSVIAAGFLQGWTDWWLVAALASRLDAREAEEWMAVEEGRARAVVLARLLGHHLPHP